MGERQCLPHLLCLYTGAQIVKKRLEALIDHLVTIPRALFGIPQGGDFTVWDLNAESSIDPKDFLSQGKATPFEGWHVNGKCLLTVCGGKAVYHDREA